MHTLFNPSITHSPQGAHVRFTRAEFILALTCLLAAILAVWGPEIHQIEHYHEFADQRAFGMIPCAWNVLSNALFLVLGLWGLGGLHRSPLRGAQRMGAYLFFTGLIVTAFGSTWYHWHPDDARLVWDRLGMIFPFAGIMALALSERISPRAAWLGAGVMLLGGSASIWVWSHTANLTPWVIVQGGGMVLLVALSLCPTRQPTQPLSTSLNLGALITWYVLAKLLEWGDAAVYDWSAQLISGHSLKHLVAALAAWPVLSWMRRMSQAKPALTAKRHDSTQPLNC